MAGRARVPRYAWLLSASVLFACGSRSLPGLDTDEDASVLPNPDAKKKALELCHGNAPRMTIDGQEIAIKGGVRTLAYLSNECMLYSSVLGSAGSMLVSFQYPQAPSLKVDLAAPSTGWKMTKLEIKVVGKQARNADLKNDRISGWAVLPRIVGKSAPTYPLCLRFDGAPLKNKPTQAQVYLPPP